MVLYWSTLVRQPLYCVPPIDDIHERDTRYLSYPPSQVSITGGDDEAFMCLYSLDEAVVGVCASM
jgi:hypothetical protein